MGAGGKAGGLWDVGVARQMNCIDFVFTDHTSEMMV